MVGHQTGAAAHSTAAVGLPSLPLACPDRIPAIAGYSALSLRALFVKKKKRGRERSDKPGPLVSDQEREEEEAGRGLLLGRPG